MKHSKELWDAIEFEVNNEPEEIDEYRDKQLR